MSENPATLWTPERRELALACLRSWHGVPHRDRIAVPGVGIDCIQLVIQVHIAAGLIPPTVVSGYDVQAGMFKQTDRLKNAIKSCADVVEADPDQPQFGDVVIFKTGTRSGHVGFYTSNELWHALAGRCVTVSRYSLWRREVDSLLRLQAAGYTGDPNAASKL